MTGLHLYAKWVPNNFEVSYFYQNDQGTETQFGDIDTYAFGTDVTVRTAHPEKAGYTFTGWANIANIVEVAADGTFTMPAQDVRFDAQFSINQYHVTYKVDGKDYGNTETYVFNSDVAIRPVPTKEGYTFTGWSGTGLDGENNMTVTIPTGSTGNRTYTAHWRYNGSGHSYSYYTIKATAGAGGSISPSGNVSVREGRDRTFTITPDKGYAVSNVKIDGKSIGAVKSYTFENVSRTIPSRSSL